MAQQAVETSNQSAVDSSSTVDGLNNTESPNTVSRSINTDGEPRSSTLGRIPHSRGPNR